MISLHRIAELGVPAAWHEAVAVAQAVSACATQSGRTLGADSCFLSVEGTVELSGIPRAAWSHATLDALQLLLKSSTEVPPALLVMLRDSEALSEAALVEKLQFFARPDQMAVIKGLAARAIQIDNETSAQNALERLREDAAAATDAGQQKEGATGKRPLFRRAGAVGAAAAAVGSLVLGGVWAARGQASAAAPATSVSASASQVVLGLRTKVDALVDSGLTSLGLAAAPSTNTTPNAAVAAAPKARRRVQAPKPHPSNSVAAANSVVDLHSTTDATPVIEPAAATETMVDANVYTAADVDVDPPALVRPQLPAPTARRGVNEATHVELHVNANGTVDRVRLYPEGSTLNDRMLVSAVKAWVFRPARKDGRPVRYSLLMPLTRH